MNPLVVWLLLSAGLPTAESQTAATDAEMLAAFPRACESGKPKKRKFAEGDFAPALQKLRADKRHLVPRAWAMTCEWMELCNAPPSGYGCPHAYGQKPPFGNPVNGGDLLILVDDPYPRKGEPKHLYAVIAKYGPKMYSMGYPARIDKIAIIDGPPLSNESK